MPIRRLLYLSDSLLLHTDEQEFRYAQPTNDLYISLGCLGCRQQTPEFL